MSAAFFYVDGIPTKGCWVDLDSIEGWSDVQVWLADAGYIKREDGEEPNYGGDILCADVEGALAKQFAGSHGTFDLDGFIEARDCGLDEDVVAAWLDNGMPFDKDEIEECYQGEHDSWIEFAEELLDSIGDLDQIPPHLRFYFDYEAFARDLRMGGDYFESNGHFFRNQ